MVEISKMTIPIVSMTKIMKKIGFSSNSLSLAKQTEIVVMTKPINSKMTKQIQTKNTV